jgi:hypothetical protein
MMDAVLHMMDAVLPTTDSMRCNSWWCPGTGEPTAQSEAQEAFFAPLSGGDDALDDFGAEDRRSAPVFGYT